MMDRLDAEAFEGARFLRPGRWVVAFVADWCPFCRSFLPRFEQYSAGHAGAFAVGDVTDLDSPLWESLELEVVPTVIGFEGGELAWRIDGGLGRGLTDADLRRIPATRVGSPGPLDR